MERLNAERRAKQEAVYGKIPPTDEEDDGEESDAFPVNEATPEMMAAEAASEEADRAEESEADFGF